MTIIISAEDIASIKIRTAAQVRNHLLTSLPRIRQEPGVFKILIERARKEDRYHAWLAKQGLLLAQSDIVSIERAFAANELILRLPSLLHGMKLIRGDHWRSARLLLAVVTSYNGPPYAHSFVDSAAHNKWYVAISSFIRLGIKRVVSQFDDSDTGFDGYKSDLEWFVYEWYGLCRVFDAAYIKADWRANAVMMSYADACEHAGSITGRFGGAFDARDQRREQLAKALDARHANNRIKRVAILNWYSEHALSFKKLGKNRAAAVAEKLFNVRFKTARNILITAKPSR